MNIMVRVAIVDDHESVRLGLKAACQEAGYDVVLTAATVDEFVSELGDREALLDSYLGHGIDDTGISLGALALQRGFA